MASGEKNCISFFLFEEIYRYPDILSCLYVAFSTKLIAAIAAHKQNQQKSAYFVSIFDSCLIFALFPTFAIHAMNKFLFRDPIKCDGVL